MKGKLIGLIVLAIIFLGIFYFLNKNNQPTVNQQNTAGSAKIYTLADISKHAKAEDCWMAIEGKVYDVTKAIPSHEGGDVIVTGCGKDATGLFNERGGKGPHPKRAQRDLESLYIGEFSK